MFFSILVPVYNVERYLQDCLESIDSQTFIDYEVVIVNDGSTDTSGSICREYKQKSNKVKLIEQSNKGLLFARRAAIEAAEGQYYVCLDSDDALKEDALRKIYDKINETNADIIVFNASNDNSFSKKCLNHSYLIDNQDEEGIIQVSIGRELLCRSFEFNQMWCKAIRNNCVGEYERFLEYQGIQYGEDVVQVADVLDRARTIAIIDESLYYYRYNEDSISKKISLKQLKDLERTHDSLALYATKWDDNLIPRIHAKSCVGILTYCIKCISRYDWNKATRHIDCVVKSDFFKKSISNASFNDTEVSKFVLIKLLEHERIVVFTVIAWSLLNIDRVLHLNKMKNYR